MLPWPVSKYITLLPMVPRFSSSAAVWASLNMERLIPKLLLVFSVPPMDWNTRSTGAFVHHLHGGGYMAEHAGLGGDVVLLPELVYQREQVHLRASGLSVAGLMPITASPLPYSSPSIIEAAMPFGSSVL